MGDSYDRPGEGKDAVHDGRGKRNEADTEHHRQEQLETAGDIVLVHDAARPCVTVECLNNLVYTVTHLATSAILAIPVRDTLKRVVQQQEIQQTVSREYLWQAQTPQASSLSQLKNAIEIALKNDVVITDEASALEFMGEIVQVVQGRSDNLKITYPDDLELARLILNAQHGKTA